MNASLVGETTQWFRSKVDWWIFPLLCLPPLVSLAACVALVLGGKTSELPWGIAGVLLVFGIYFGLVFPMRYGLDDTHLLVRFGLCCRRIALIEILEVHPTRNPLSSPALSLDRLHVQFGQGWRKAVMISPADRSRFLDELARKGALKREGDRLFRE